MIHLYTGKGKGNNSCDMIILDEVTYPVKRKWIEDEKLG